MHVHLGFALRALGVFALRQALKICREDGRIIRERAYLTPERTRTILGIDPGIALVGYAVVVARGNERQLLVCDALTTPATMPLAERLQLIYTGLSAIVRTYKPQEAAVEQLFFAKNARTAMAVGHGRGVAMLALINGGLSIAEYTPLQVKQAVTGYGHAGKQQVGEMVRVLLNLRAVPKPDDAADAAAIAICHLNTAAYARV